MSDVTPPRPATPAGLPLPVEPFRGIEPFRYFDRQIFFARGEETRKLLRRVILYRGVLLYGESGTGKSSLINAGFIPAAIADGFTPERLRLQPRRGEEIVVGRISDTGRAAGPYLRSNFAGNDAPQAVLSVESFMNSLRRLPRGERPLLVFDQFEEFVTLFEEAQPGLPPEEARRCQERVLGALVEVLRDEALPAKVLLVFREDYLAKLGKLFALCPDLPDQHLRLLTLGADALPKIIRGPFETFPKHFGTELSQELAETLASEFKARSEMGRISLSEVQIACLKLWRSGDPTYFFGERGIEGLLEEHLSEALDQLGPWLRDPALALLTHMVTPSGTRNVISTGDLLNMVKAEERHSQGPLEGAQEALLKATGLVRREGVGRRDLFEAALEALVNQTGLVRRELRRNTHYHELVSEFLIPKISQEQRERAKRLARSERRKRMLAWGVAGGCIILAALSFYYYSRAERESHRAAQRDEDVRRLTAEKDTTLIEGALLGREVEENETSDTAQRGVAVACPPEACGEEAQGRLISLGFQVSPRRAIDRGAGEVSDSINTIAYAPGKIAKKDLREVALVMIRAGHNLKRIIPDQRLSRLDKPSIEVRGDKTSEPCIALALGDIMKPTSYFLPAPLLWEMCDKPRATLRGSGVAE